MVPSPRGLGPLTTTETTHTSEQRRHRCPPTTHPPARRRTASAAAGQAPDSQAPADQAPADHRRLGRELKLFATEPLVGAGLPLWLPDGAVIRAELERLAAEEAIRGGCQPVYTPVLAKRALFERSGHWAKFADDMFPPMRVGEEEFVLRPANCPHHALVYASEQRSYRDLPVRLAELGAMFRSELSGVLGGLARVRQINLDDTHVFCAPEQMPGEIALAVQSVQRCYRLLGIDVARYRLSRRGPGGGYLGGDDLWAAAEGHLAAVLRDLGLDYEDAPGEAAFYGPKIDVQVADPAGREETLSTVQLDFNQPERFDLCYIGPDGGRHRPGHDPSRWAVRDGTAGRAPHRAVWRGVPALAGPGAGGRAARGRAARRARPAASPTGSARPGCGPSAIRPTPPSGPGSARPASAGSPTSP